MPREGREERRERRRRERTNNGNTNEGEAGGAAAAAGRTDKTRRQRRGAAPSAAAADPDAMMDDMNANPGNGNAPTAGLNLDIEDSANLSNNNNNNNNNPNNNDLPEAPSFAGSNSQYTDDISSYLDRTLSELQVLCDAASESDPASWENIRRWLRNHSAEDARAAAERRGDYETTPLHLACRNCPPLDIVTMLLTASPNTVELADSFGWLPLHYACANEASEEVLVMLAEQYPESKTSVDRRRRTPLHFALGHTERPANVATVVLLSGTGAALMADENGMLPLHYACAYGATDKALRVLTDENIQTITATDNRGRTPLHFALGNADRPASPGVVGLLLSQNPAVVDSIDLEGNLPIHLLATRAQAIRSDENEKCDNCQECFGLYLNAHPSATADLLTALQSLPDWLRDSAVLSPVVQKILNIKISQRFPTAITILDFVVYFVVIGFFQVSVNAAMADRSAMKDGKEAVMNKAVLIPLYLSVFYFSVREVVQSLSLASLGLFKTWAHDLTNWVDVIYILLIFFWSVIMTVDGLPLEAFQNGAALSMAVFWGMVLIFLQSIFVGFAVFVGGVAYVLKRLAAFLVALVIILMAFAQMFYTLFLQTEECAKGTSKWEYIETISSEFTCTEPPTDTIYNNCTKSIEDCEPINDEPFCSLTTSFIKVWTMLLGEVDDTLFQEPLATVLYAAFVFICVIVLANVLIAIVTDSYGVIQNERAALVFWSNRLDFVAEMDVISNNFSRRGRDRDAQSNSPFDYDDSNMAELWKKFMYLFDDDIDEHGVLSFEFIVYNVLRVFAAFIIIPLWIVLGFVSLGLLWPPQVREKMLTSKMAARTKEVSAEQTRLQEVGRLKEDMESFQKEVRVDMEKGRDEVYLVKTVLDNTKMEIHSEMNNVKEIVTELFELLSAP